jgi:hypothetical protein
VVVTADQIMADVQATVAAIPGIIECAWPPPENAPVQGPATWLDYGPAEWEMGSLEIGRHQVTVTIATPRKGDYPSEYRTVLAVGKQIVVAFRGNTLVAGEAAMMAPATLNKPIAGTYGGESVVACTVTFVVETEEEVANQILP